MLTCCNFCCAAEGGGRFLQLSVAARPCSALLWLQIPGHVHYRAPLPVPPMSWKSAPASPACCLSPCPFAVTTLQRQPANRHFPRPLLSNASWLCYRLPAAGLPPPPPGATAHCCCCGDSVRLRRAFTGAHYSQEGMPPGGLAGHLVSLYEPLVGSVDVRRLQRRRLPSLLHHRHCCRRGANGRGARKAAGHTVSPKPPAF